MKIYDLIPTDGRKSFYGKAKVYIDNDCEILVSYNTPIIKKETKTGKLVNLWDGWSTTTGRHIKAFCGLDKKGVSILETDFNFTL